ncbi:MAG: hypothetical protein ACYS47_16740 [Planctomycetota bacterium]|jgi:hypothetical protein
MRSVLSVVVLCAILVAGLIVLYALTGETETAIETGEAEAEPGTKDPGPTAVEKEPPSSPSPPAGTGGVRGIVRLAGSESPVNLAALKLLLFTLLREEVLNQQEEPDEGPFFTAETGVKDGVFIFSSVPPGDYRAAFRANELGATGIPFLEVKDGETTHVEIAFEKTATVHFTFTLGGVPMAEQPVQVEAQLQPGPFHPLAVFSEDEGYADYGEADPRFTKIEGKTDREGRFTARSIPPGLQWFSGSCGGIPWTLYGTELEPGGAVELTVTLPEAVLEGRIVTPEGKPVAGAEISAWLDQKGRLRWKSGTSRCHGTSGPDGEFRFPGVVAGTWVINTKKPGYGAGYLPGIELPSGPLTVTMKWRGLSTIPVRLVHRGGAPYVAESVNFGFWSQRKPAPAKADPDVPGLFLVENISSGSTVKLQPYMEGWICAPVSRSVKPAPGRNPEVEFVLFPPPEVIGRVLDEKGRLLIDTEIRVTSQSLHEKRNGRPLWEGQTVKTDGEGRFRFQSRYVGEFTVRVSCTRGSENLGGKSGNLLFEPDKVTDAGDIALRVEWNDAPPEGCSISATIRVGDRGGRLRARTIYYRLTSEGDLWNEDNHITDAEGRVSIKGLDPGTYELRIGAEGHVPAFREGIVLPSGGTASFDLVLKPARESLVGRLVTDPPGDAVGMPLYCGHDWDAGLVSFGFCMAGLTAGQEGRFLLPNLPPGRYYFSLSDPEYLPAGWTVDWNVGDAGATGGSEPVKRVGPGEVLELKPVRGGEITGRVEYADGSSCRGFHVQARPLAKKGWRALHSGRGIHLFDRRSSVTCNSKGEFRIRGLPGGMYKVTCYGKSETVDVRLGAAAGPVVIHLGATQPSYEWKKVKYRVFLPDGRPAAGASVWSFRDDMWPRPKVVGTADAMGGLEGHRYLGARIFAFARLAGYAPSKTVIVGTDGPEDAVDLHLRVSAVVWGRFALPSGIDPSTLLVAVGPMDAKLGFLSNTIPKRLKQRAEEARFLPVRGRDILSSAFSPTLAVLPPIV